MGVLEEFFVKAKVAVDAIGEKAGKIVDVSKLNVKMAELKSSLKSEYERLGKVVYNSRRDNVPDESNINYEVAQIANLSLQIEELKKQIASVKNKVLCKSCGQPTELGSKFCSSCGEKIDYTDEEIVIEGDEQSDDFDEFDD